MITILGKEYLTDKEVARIFGYSQAWFIKRRTQKKGPPYVKIESRILYERKAIEDWFSANMCKY